MKEIQELHKKAMELAEAASLEQKLGNHERAKELFTAALESESKAAGSLDSRFDLEPTRSVLFRSAASLALDCHDHRSAEKLLARGLAGDPPPEIASELRDLLEQVGFHRHLEIRGIVLEPREFQMSIAGNSVASGLAESEVFIGRVQDLEKLLFRTAEMQLNRPFREKGRRERRLAEDIGLYISAPRAASFAVTFRIGYSKQMTLPGLDIGKAVINGLLDSIEILESGCASELESRIPDPAYRRNFLALARRLAPDGEAVSLVGFTTGHANTERRVYLRKLQSEIPAVEPIVESKKKGKHLTVKGILKYADSTKKEHKEIKVVDNRGKKYRIIVPEGMMDDIVRPLWDFEVSVEGRLCGKIIHLEDIKKE